MQPIVDVSLVLLGPGGTTREVPLSRPRTLLGRGQGCHIRLPLASVSRDHLELTIGNGAVRLRDRGSSNGSYVNAKRVTEAELKAGDVIGVGPMLFVVRINGEPGQIDADAIRASMARGPAAGGAEPAPAAAAGAPRSDDDDDPLSAFESASSDASSVVDFDFDELTREDDEDQPRL